MSIGSMIEVTQPSDPRIRVFLNQKDAWLKAKHNPQATEPDTPDHGRFIAEGTLVVEHLLASRFPVESIFVSHSRVPGVHALLEQVPARVPIYVAEQSVMDTIVGFPVHRGLLACGRRLPNPDPIKLATQSRALIVLEDLSNHDNLGSVFRSVAALGGRGVSILLSARCCDPLYRKALRVSMGHALTVPFAFVDDLPAFLPELHKIGFSSFALTPDPTAKPISQLKNTELDRPVLCFGAEGPGLTKQIMQAAQYRIRIPMAQEVDSLNIAVAAAVCMYTCLSPTTSGSDGLQSTEP